MNAEIAINNININTNTICMQSTQIKLPHQHRMQEYVKLRDQTDLHSLKSCSNIPKPEKQRIKTADR